MTPVEYKHDNGYSAVLYGKASMTIYHKGKKVLHTSSRKPNTEEEVMEALETMPEFWKGLAESCVGKTMKEIEEEE